MYFIAYRIYCKYNDKNLDLQYLTLLELQVADLLCFIDF